MMAAMNKHLGWIQIIVTVAILLFGFNYSNGQQAQVVKDTSQKIEECRIEIKSIRADQTTTIKELTQMIQEVKLALVELKTETKYLSQRRRIDQ
jgi:ribosome recycling factor